MAIKKKYTNLKQATDASNVSIECFAPGDQELVDGAGGEAKLSTLQDGGILVSAKCIRVCCTAADDTVAAWISMDSPQPTASVGGSNSTPIPLGVVEYFAIKPLQNDDGDNLYVNNEGVFPGLSVAGGKVSVTLVY